LLSCITACFQLDEQAAYFLQRGAARPATEAREKLRRDVQQPLV
jgi:hypothetical protein